MFNLHLYLMGLTMSTVYVGVWLLHELCVYERLSLARMWYYTPERRSYITFLYLNKVKTIYSDSSARRRAAPLVRRMSSSAARSTMAFLFRAETAAAISPQYWVFCMRRTSSSLTLFTTNFRKPFGSTCRVCEQIPMGKERLVGQMSRRHTRVQVTR